MVEVTEEIKEYLKPLRLELPISKEYFLVVVAR